MEGRVFVVRFISFLQDILFALGFGCAIRDAAVAKIAGEVVRPFVSASLFPWDRLVRDHLLGNHN